MTALRIDLPHVWDVDGKPVGTGHEMALDGETLVVREYRLDGEARSFVDERRLNFTEVVHALLNATPAEIAALGTERMVRPRMVQAPAFSPAGALTEAQRDGRACVGCGGDEGPMRPTGGRGDGGAQLFAHARCWPSVDDPREIDHSVPHRVGDVWQFDAPDGPRATVVEAHDPEPGRGWYEHRIRLSHDSGSAAHVGWWGGQGWERVALAPAAQGPCTCGSYACMGGDLCPDSETGE